MKKIKKHLLLFAVIVTALVCFALLASALDATGQCGDNVSYIYNNNTWELIIGGTGPMRDYDYGKSPFNVSVIGSVVIGENVTTIGDSAFSDCIALSRVTIGDSVTRIGDGAFSGCNFNSIVIPDSVTTIGESAFFCCYYLKSIIIPESVITIGDLAFYYCTAIKDVYYSGTEEQWDRISIGSGNGKLTGATIHYNYCSHTDTNSDKFCDDCGKYTEKLYKSDKCGENVTYEWYEDGMVIVSGTGAMTDYENYDGSPFYYSNIKSVVINDGITTIGDYAFYECDSLTKVTIGDSVTTIGDYAFDYCDSLTEVSIGDSVTTIGDYAFSSCDSLTEVTIPDSVTTIGYAAFYSCDSLTEVTIGNSVTTIGNSAFSYCRSLTEVTIPDSVTTIGNYAFAGDAFGGSSLTKVTIGDSVTTIGDSAFEYCNSLTEVTIPDSVTTIGKRAFYSCDSLTEVYYGGTQKQWKKIKIGSYNDDLISANIHYTCYHINKTTHAQQNPTCTAKGYTAGIYCPDCENWLSGHEVISAKGHTDTDSDKYCDICKNYTEKLYKSGKCGDNVTYEWYEDCMVIISGTGAMTDYEYNSSPFYYTDIKSVVINDGVTTIGENVFRECYELGSVTIGDSVTKIGNYAFYNYCALDSIVIPDCVTIIGDYAFSGDCFGSFSLKNVVIGNGVTSIGNYAFAGETIGTHLTNVTIGNNVKTIGKMAFFFSDKLTNLTIPDSVTTIGDGAFSNCFNLECITIGTGVTTIGDYAFDMDSGFGEPNLKNVIYSDSIASWRLINIGRFNNCLINANIIYSACNITTRLQQNATCTENGYTAGTYCPDCDSWLSGHTVITAKGHSYTEKIIDSKHLKSKATVEKSAVYKYDCANCDSISPDKTFTHGNTLALGVTSSVTATQTTSSLTLTWSKAANATGYRLYYKLPGDMSWRASVSYITATTKTFSGLPSGQAYRFAIRSAYKKADGTYILGGYKEIATATKATAPADVYSFQNSSAIRLIWTASKGATGYRIYYKSGNAWKVCVSTTSATVHTFNNLKSGAKFTFAIRPYIKTESGVIWSDYITHTTATKTISPVVTLTSSSKGKLNLSWKAVNGAESYEVYYKVGNGNYKLYKTFTSVQNLTFTGLKSGAEYTFAVRGVIKGTDGKICGYHNPVKVTVK